MSDDHDGEGGENTPRDHIYVTELPSFWRWTTDYHLAFQLATGETIDGWDGEGEHPQEWRISVMHTRRSRPVLDLASDHPTEACIHRSYECGHLAYGPPKRLPSECPECHPVATDGGEIDQHPRDTSQRWIGQAEQNVEQWGNQPPLVVLLALVEEIAEAADEALATAERPAALDHDPYHKEAMVLLSQIRRDGFACREFLEEHFEDDQGDPLPADEVPSLAYALDRGRVLVELEDAAPLVYQLRWALAGKGGPA